MTEPGTLTLAEALEGVRRFTAQHGRLAMDSALLADAADAALGAVWRALGPLPELLWGKAEADARARRPELAAREPDLLLAVPADAVLYTPLALARARLARLEELAAPEVILEHERAALAGLAAQPEPATEWQRVFVLADELARWPGYTRRGALSIAVARQVLPAWTADDQPALLLDDAARALREGRRARRLDLRDQLSQRSYEVEGRAGAALRAAFQAHDRVTQNPARDDQTELEYLAEQAWPDPPATFAPWWIEQVRAAAADSPGDDSGRR
ncbi:MAG: hypothetical protein IT370_14665 [Deltaproteobacteria bacterium]|nr:hypothetical protein [Deltaproteobacteria bacterium]